MIAPSNNNSHFCDAPTMPLGPSHYVRYRTSKLNRTIVAIVSKFHAELNGYSCAQTVAQYNHCTNTNQRVACADDRRARFRIAPSQGVARLIQFEEA